jgi:putative ABC transport system permease protein
MSLQSRWASLIRNLFHRRRVDRDLDDELRSYVDLLTNENRDAGMTAEAARRAVLVRTQGVTQLKERVQDVRAGAAIEQTLRDVSYGLRMAIRNRGFTAAAVVTLALGIGASTAMFSLVDTVVFRPLPYTDPDRLVKIWASSSPEPTDNVSWLELGRIAEQSQIFERVAADDGTGFSVEFGGSKHQANGAMVTPEWLATLGVQPVKGRDFVREEGQPGRDGVLILTDTYWRRRFAADPNIVGKAVLLDGRGSTVIGVLPPNVLRYEADFLKPLVSAEYPPNDRNLDVFARIRRGVTIADVRAAMNSVGRVLEQASPATYAGVTFRVVSLEKYYALVDPAASRGLLLMLGAVGLVLLIACVNVANLLLARSAARCRECLIRGALGASRGRLVRQLLAENMLLFLAGGLLGSFVALWSVESVAAFAKTQGYVPNRMVVPVDARVLLFSLAVSLLAGLTFGLGPALRLSHLNLSDGLRDFSQTVNAVHRSSRTRRGLIVVELMLSVVLLVGFGLLIRSLMGLYGTTAGFTAEGLIETGTDTGRDFSSSVRFWQASLDRVRAMPGVQAVAVSSRPPVHGGRLQKFAIEGRTDGDPAGWPSGGDILISAHYFETMKIPMLKGRAFTDRDTASAPPVAIVSDTLARRYFPKEDPIGRRIRLNERGQLSCCMAAGSVDYVWREIVGVAADIRQGNVDDEPAATIYRPFTQIVEHDMYLMVRARSAADAPRIVKVLPDYLRSVDSAREWWDVQLSTQVISESGSIRSRRFMLILLGTFAALGVLLAAIGIYGVMAYFVVERRREIAVRMALGAARPAVLKHILSEATRLVVTGLALGGIAAYFLTRAIASILFGVTSTDVTTYVTVSCLLTAVALFASYLPARRASRIDPMVALRES